jgi:hypothetical protein
MTGRRETRCALYLNRRLWPFLLHLIRGLASVKSPVEIPFKYWPGISASMLGHPTHILKQNLAAKGTPIAMPNPRLAKS